MAAKKRIDWLMVGLWTIAAGLVLQLVASVARIVASR